MQKPKRWIKENLERRAFEQIIRDVFSKYRDNLMCSKDTIEDITIEASKLIRAQLEGVKSKSKD